MISDARLPVAPVSRPVRTEIESGESTVVMSSSETSLAPTDTVPAVSHAMQQESPSALNGPMQKPLHHSVERRFESSIVSECSVSGLEEHHPVSQPPLAHTEDSAPRHESETANPLSQADMTSTAPDKSQADDSVENEKVVPQEYLPPQHGPRHSMMVETGAVAQETGMPADFKDFIRLADTLHSNAPVVEVPPETSAETTRVMRDHTPVIQTPDSSLQIRNLSRNEHADPEHTAPAQAAPKAKHSDPVAAKMQQAAQWLGGESQLKMSVSGPGTKKEERHQQAGVKIGRIDVVIEAPVQSSPVHVEQQQTSSYGFSSRHYLRGV